MLAVYVGCSGETSEQLEVHWSLLAVYVRCSGETSEQLDVHWSLLAVYVGCSGETSEQLEQTKPGRHTHAQVRRQQCVVTQLAGGADDGGEVSIKMLFTTTANLGMTMPSYFSSLTCT